MTQFVIFTDIDGPLATGRANYATGDQYDPIACGLLARLCRDTGAQLVISSARRRNDNLVADLIRVGLAPYLFPDPDHWRTGWRDGVRGDEIDDWLAANPGHAYAILDDEKGGIHPHQLPRLAHTDMYTGLSVGDIFKLKRLMGHDVRDKDIDDDSAQTPRITIAQMAKDALRALDQGDDDGAQALLALIADHPLAQ